MKFKDLSKKFRHNISDPFAIQEGGIKYGKLKNGYKLSWTEEIFAHGDSGSETIGKNFEMGKITLLTFVMVLFLFIAIGRAAWLQIIKGQYYYELAEGNRIRIERLEAKRGVIYDSNHNPLVRNIANFLLYFVPSDLPKDDGSKNEIIARVSNILGVSTDEIKAILDKVKPGSLESYQPLFIADNIEYEKAMLLFLESDRMPGVVITNKTRREYNLSSKSLSHVLGYTGKINEDELKKYGSEYLPIDYIGKTGIENFYENELKGINGKKQIEVDALGKEKKIINQENGEDGHNLVLTINLELQKKLEDAIAETLKKMNLTKASAVVMNPNNGEILAMVSLPAFDDNLFAHGISTKDYEQLINDPNRPLYNRTVSGEYPSGSTIKPIYASAALEENIINENTSFISSGGLRVGEWFFPDWKAGGHGVTNVRKAIAESVNTFFYYIGGGYNDFTGLGIEKMGAYAKLYGLGSQTGIDIVGEADGFIPTKEWKEETKGERWYIGDTYHAAIGQGDILVTPLQVANYAATFANGGKLYRPHLVKEILNSDESTFRKINEKPIRTNIVSDKNMQIVREGMRQTVTAGSARSLQSVSVPVAGKTGTAQWSTTKKPHAWFIGFAPYDNPQISIMILVEEGVEGSSVAVPIANQVLTWYFGPKVEASAATSTPQ